MVGDVDRRRRAHGLSHASSSTTRGPPTSGSAVRCPVSTSDPTDPVALFDQDGQFLALYEQRATTPAPWPCSPSPKAGTPRVADHEDAPDSSPRRVLVDGCSEAGSPRWRHRRRAHGHHQGAQAEPRPPRRRLPRTTDPTAVPVGGSTTITTYTYGADLYEDMLDRHRGRAGAHPVRDVHHQGRRGGPAVQAGADPGGRARRRGLRHLRRVREPRRAARASCGSRRRCTCCGTRCCSGWMVFNPRRWGRDHRKILVVDDTAASWAATTSARCTPRSGATPTSRSRAVGLGPRQRVRRLLEPATPAACRS